MAEKEFDSPKSAEDFYFPKSSSVGVQASFSRTEVAVQADKSTNLVNAGVQTEHSSVRDLGAELEVGSVVKIFLEVSASAMVKLKAGNKSNVVYNLAKGVGTNRLDEFESRFPVARVPMGLVEYTTNFLCSG